MEQTNDPISDESSMSLDEIRIKLCESEKILNMLKDSSLKDSLSLVQDLLMRNETIMKKINQEEKGSPVDILEINSNLQKILRIYSDIKKTPKKSIK